MKHLGTIIFVILVVFASSCLHLMPSQAQSNFTYTQPPPGPPNNPHVGIFNPPAPALSGSGASSGSTTYTYAVVAYGYDVNANLVPTLMGGTATTTTGQAVLSVGTPIILTTQVDAGSAQYDFLKLVSGVWKSICLAVVSAPWNGAGITCTDTGQVPATYALSNTNATADVVTSNLRTAHFVAAFTGLVQVTGNSGNDFVSNVSVNGVKNAASFSGADIGAKINAAIAAFPAGTCGSIFVPAGTYSFSTTIQFPVAVAPPGTACLLYGAGIDATILQYTGSGDAINQVMSSPTYQNSRGVVIRDLTLDGLNATGNAIGFHFGGTLSQRDDFRIVNFAGSSQIAVEADNSSNTLTTNDVDVRFQFTNDHIGLELTGSQNFQHDDWHIDCGLSPIVKTVGQTCVSIVGTDASRDNWWFQGATAASVANIDTIIAVDSTSTIGSGFISMLMECGGSACPQNFITNAHVATPVTLAGFAFLTGQYTLPVGGGGTANFAITDVGTLATISH